MKSTVFLVGLLVLAAASFSGCATNGVSNPSGVSAAEIRPDEKGIVSTLGIESQDLLRVCDKMARGILSCPQIANAANPPCVVLDPVRNDTMFPIHQDLFLDRISVQLIANTQGKVNILSRENMDKLIQERELQRSGQVTSSADPNVQAFKGADFILTGKLTDLPEASAAGRSEYILYTFELIDARTSVVVWGAMDEIKKQGQDDAVYR